MRLNSAVTWTANSLVGVSITACTSAWRVFMDSARGMPKAAVLPVPVCACPTTSLPFSRAGNVGYDVCKINCHDVGSPSQILNSLLQFRITVSIHIVLVDNTISPNSNMFVSPLPLLLVLNYSPKPSQELLVLPHELCVLPLKRVHDLSNNSIIPCPELIQGR